MNVTISKGIFVLSIFVTSTKIMHVTGFAYLQTPSKYGSPIRLPTKSSAAAATFSATITIMKIATEPLQLQLVELFRSTSQEIPPPLHYPDFGVTYNETMRNMGLGHLCHMRSRGVRYRNLHCPYHAYMHITFHRHLFIKYFRETQCILKLIQCLT